MRGMPAAQLSALFKACAQTQAQSVLQVRANGLIVFIPKFGIEGVVHLNPKDDGKSTAAGGFHLDEERQTVASPDGSLAYTVFDKVLPVHASPTLAADAWKAWACACACACGWACVMLSCVLLFHSSLWPRSSLPACAARPPLCSSNA